MKWLKRSCWLAAWGVWLWLGFGLYRELPRDLGPIVYKLNRGNDARVMGFVGSKNQVAMLRRDSDELLLEGFDAETGARTPLSETLTRDDSWSTPCRAELRSGVFPTRLENGGSVVGYRTLNLENGEWSWITESQFRKLGRGYATNKDELPRRPVDGEDLFYSDGDTSFFVIERWHHMWSGQKPRYWTTTVALRNLKSGELICRTTYDQWIERENTNADETLGVKNDGTVHSLPYRVNWPLLALCQAILALPLVQLWAVLCWRRKKRALT